MSILGQNGVVYVWDSTVWKPLACLTSTSLSSELSMIESSTKCFPGVVKKTPSQLNNSIECEGEFIDTTSIGGDTAKMSHDKLFLIQQSKIKQEFKYDSNVTDSDSAKYFGFGYFTNLTLDQGSGDELSTFSVTLDVDGGITLNDPHAPLIPVMTSPNNVAISNGTSGTFQIVGTNTPTSYGITGSNSLPSGVTLNLTSGLISWTNAVVVGVYTVQIVIFNAVGFTSPQTITFNVT